MSSISVKQKFLFPVIVIVGSIVIIAGWFFSSHEISKQEQANQDKLVLLAQATRIMIHSAAQELCDSSHLSYYRTSFGKDAQNEKLTPPEQKAIEYFTSHPDAEQFIYNQTENGEPKMFVFTPGKLRDECNMCHTTMGLTLPGKNGDMVALFGVGESLQQIHHDASIQRIIVLLCGGIILLLLVGMLLAIMSRIFIRPLQNLTIEADIAATGDLTTLVEVRSHDEVGKVAVAFNAMINNLKNTIAAVQEASASIGSASTQISSSAEQLASGSRTQSSKASDVASAVEEMSASIATNSKSTQETVDTAEHVQKAAEHGGEIVDSTIQHINRIAQVVKNSADTVHQLGISSDKIGEIISVIDDIADQTNMLALNAAIEAARAGEQGRGFAVVADEVRKLAERTTKATKEIAEMIRKIQNETTGAVSAIERGTKEVDEGIRLADEAGSSLRIIVESIQSLNKKINQISNANREQSIASESIAKNMENISNITDENAHATEQIALATEDLNRLIESLRTMLKRFQIELPKTAKEEKVVLTTHQPMHEPVAVSV